MSKSRIMGAASSGYNYGANKNSPGNGNGKWQGLWPSVGHARNTRYINTRARRNRNVVFCMNQLGGVGRISNMFATTADGASCHSTTTACHLPPHVSEALSILKAYASTQNKNLCLIGVSEKFKKDTGLNNDSFKRLTANDFSKPEQIDAMNTINNLKLRFRVTSRHSDVEDHVCALIDDAGAKKLKEKNYGIPTLCDNIIAYGDAGIVSGEYKEGDDNIKIFVDIPTKGLDSLWYKYGYHYMIIDLVQPVGPTVATIFESSRIGTGGYFKTYGPDKNEDYNVKTKPPLIFRIYSAFKEKDSLGGTDDDRGNFWSISVAKERSMVEALDQRCQFKYPADHGACANLPECRCVEGQAPKELFLNGKYMFEIPLDSDSKAPTKLKIVAADGSLLNTSDYLPFLRIRYQVNGRETSSRPFDYLLDNN